MSNAVKSLTIAMVFGYSLEYTGGAQSAFLDEARALIAAGHRVLFVTPGKREQTSVSGAKHLYIKHLFTLPGVDMPVVRNTKKLRDRLRREFIAHGVDAVHVQAEFGVDHAAIQVANKLGLPTVFTVHTIFWQSGLSGITDRIAGFLVRKYVKFLTGVYPLAYPAKSRVDAALRGATAKMVQSVRSVVSPSAHQARTIEQNTGAENVYVVPNTQNLDFAPGEPLTEASQPLRVLWVSRMMPEKRPLEFLEAVRQCQAPLDVTMIGDGNMLEKAQQFVSENNLPVRLLGKQSRADVRREMDNAHIVALSSFGFDNQPVVIIEALHARRSVFLCDKRLTEGLSECGWYAESETPAAMADALAEIAGDSEWLIRASESAVTGALVFSPESHIRALIPLYAK